VQEVCRKFAGKSQVTGSECSYTDACGADKSIRSHLACDRMAPSAAPTDRTGWQQHFAGAPLPARHHKALVACRRAKDSKNAPGNNP
jgi:hypothetical protein